MNTTTDGGQLSRKNISPPRSCCGYAPTSPAKPGWTIGRARIPGSSLPPRAWKSTGSSISPRQIRASGRRPSASKPTSPSIERSTGSRKSPSSPPCRRSWAAGRRSWLSRTRSTCSAAPCSTPGPPGSSRWYDVAGPGRNVGARALVYLAQAKRCQRAAASESSSRRNARARSSPAPAADGTPHADLHALVREALGHPGRRARQPEDQHFHASLSLGFADRSARAAFFDESRG